MISQTHKSFRPLTAHPSHRENPFSNRGAELRKNNWCLGDTSKTPGVTSFVTSNMVNYNWV